MSLAKVWHFFLHWTIWGHMFIHSHMDIFQADGNILLHFGYMQYVNIFHADGKILWHFALVVCTWIFFHVDVLACHCLYFPSWKIFFMILIYFMAYSYAESIFYSCMDFFMRMVKFVWHIGWIVCSIYNTNIFLMLMF